jgi:predicted nucleotidyltransferase
MDKESAIEIAKLFSNEILKEFDTKEIFLFGSYANDKNNDESDIDIAVVVNNFNLDYLQSINRLYQLRRKIEILIEPHLFINGYDPSGLLENIKKIGLRIL